MAQPVIPRSGALLSAIDDGFDELYAAKIVNDLAVVNLAKTSVKVDSYAAFPTASNQYDSSTGNLIAMSATFGTASVLSGGGPNGEDVTRCIIDSGVNGRARMTVGGAAASTSVLNAPTMYVANAGCSAIYYRVNANSSGDTTNNITLQTFAWELGYAGTSHENNSLVNNAAAFQERGRTGEWVLWLLNPGNYGGGGIGTTAIGSVSLGAIASANVSGRTSTVDIGAIYFNIKQRPSFTIGFDNNDSSHYTAFQFMEKLNLKGQLYCVPKEWNRPTVLTDVQITEMAAAGWGIGAHSNGSTLYSDVGWYGLGKARVIQDLAPDLEILKRYSENGWKHGAWPLGRFDADSIEAVQGLGMLSWREIGSNATGFPLTYGGRWWIYGFGAFASNPSAFTWAQIKAVIDNTITNGAHQEIWCHSLTLSMPLFQKTMNYLAALRDNGTCDIFTAEERYDAHIANSFI